MTEAAACAGKEGVPTLLATRRKKLNVKIPPRKRGIVDVCNEGFATFYTLGKELVHPKASNRNRVFDATKVGGDGEQFVIKVRERTKNQVTEQGWRSVMETILNATNEKTHCICIEDVMVDNDNFYVVTKRMKGGELYDFLVSESEVPESEVKRLLREILLALKHLHDLGMIHRDVKPENILFESQGKKLKLIDFDLCQPWSPESPASPRVVGTPGFIAPECMLGEFSPLSDLWSVGVIFYVLMVGDLPYSLEMTLESDFECRSPKSRDVYTKMCDQPLDWEESPWPEFPDARDLCRRLLDVSTEHRIQSVDDALKHPFLR